MNELLQIFHKAGHTNLPTDTRALLNTPRFTKITPCGTGEYFNYGLQKSLEEILHDNTLGQDIEINVGVDGVPINKTGTVYLWPIIGKVTKNGSLTPFLIGSYHGDDSHPHVEFLEQFIKEYKNLNEKGFYYNGLLYKVKIKCVICDTPGRCLVLAIKGYNGFYGCKLCDIKGSWAGKVVFLSEDGELRTDFSFRSREQPEHHNGDSPFECLDINMVEQFPLDYMHLVRSNLFK